jgi:hypothetical protein
MLDPDDQKELVRLAHKYGSTRLRDSVEEAILVMANDRKQELFDVLVRKGWDPDDVQQALDVIATEPRP